ncbi:hypothetical protein [Streptomyces abikoensis]|uniref:Uncharacterized protein n=1 Tax=Streptomyces abikoensis TaxID=97398 RepID=A0ABW7TDI7_9ACTN
MDGIDLRTAFLFTLVAVATYIAYRNPALGTAAAVALAVGLFADHFLRRP